MNVALGLRPHSGWAALIALGARCKAPVLVDRRRIELADEEWAKQPYHAEIAALKRAVGAPWGEDQKEAAAAAALALRRCR